MILRRQAPTHSEISLASLASGLVGAMGRDFTSEVIQHIQDTFAARGVLLTDCGTSALTLAIKLAVGTSGRPVALPAYACYDLVTAAVGANAQIVFYDLDPATLAPDRPSLLRALRHEPAAIVVAHLYGIPVQLQELRTIADHAGALLIEDAAQAVGTTVDGRPAGSFGSLSVLSFGRGKGLTGGAGGALLSNDAASDALFEEGRQFIDARSRAGWDAITRAALQWVLARPSLYAIPAAIPALKLGETVYHNPHPPGRMPQAAIAALQCVWNVSHEAAQTRRRNAQRLLGAIRRSSDWQAIELIGADAQPGYLRLPVVARSAPAARLTAAAGRLGIMRGYPIPLHELHAAMPRRLNGSERLPMAELLAERLTTLPTHRLLSRSDLDALETWLLQPRAAKVRSTGAEHAPVISLR